jgi:hypothetical protein
VVRRYDSANCPCPSDCRRRGDCKACRDFHHARKEPTYCEFLYQQENAPPTPERALKGGRELRLMDFGPCAG